ncbi:MAG: PIN domain-containing protein [Elusimicrobia bacterium]|nr:PIN domain-containing protein [Candidatus Liberimonas magnetica]
MVLVDTSVWIDYFRHGNKHIEELLEEDEIIIHEFVIGELACGNIKNRKEILRLLTSLPMTKDIRNDEILKFIESNNLMGIGLGLIDIYLLSSCLLSNAVLWTLDKKLKNTAKILKINYVQMN